MSTFTGFLLCNLGQVILFLYTLVSLSVNGDYNIYLAQLLGLNVCEVLTIVPDTESALNK